MTFDGEHFNSNLDGELRQRMYRLLRDARPDHHDYETVQLYGRAHEELFRYQPTHAELATPWHMAVVVLGGVHQRLVDVAREFRKADVADRGTYPEFFDIQRRLDDEENEWRASLGLEPVDSQAE